MDAISERMLALLIITLFPLAKATGAAAMVRGVGVALLSILLVASLAGPERLPYWGTTLAIGWAYAVVARNLALPAGMHVFPTGDGSRRLAWLGLALLGLGCICQDGKSSWIGNPCWFWPPICCCCWRNSAWPGFAWLGVLVLTWAGVAAGIAYNIEPLWAIGPATLTRLAGATLVWANLLLLAVPWWQRYGERIAAWLNWRLPDCRRRY